MQGSEWPPPSTDSEQREPMKWGPAVMFVLWIAALIMFLMDRDWTVLIVTMIAAVLTGALIDHIQRKDQGR